MNKKQAIQEINETQEYYVNELIKKLLNTSNDYLKTINFTSPTGTGKTNMMSLLCNKMSDYYFIITTLSKGQLNIQIAKNMKNLVKQNNFIVYGLCDYTSNTKRTAEDIINLLPSNKKIIWLRDEGHINTNKWQEILKNRCFKVINFSATNKENNGIKCNFTNTMMLRTVHQQEGTPEDALNKLLEVKKCHKNIKNYNPCAIMRCLDKNIEERIIEDCKKLQLKYINITEENFNMTELCKDDNEYDVIINKFKIVEGIDIRRAHVLYMTNEPSNIATTIQLIGRCRRNALLYRNDVDIFEDEQLLTDTRQCYVFYNIQNMNVETDESGELCQAFCDHISCQELKPDSIIDVKNGQLANGLYIIELENETGTYRVEIDPETGFNVIKPEGVFYKKEILDKTLRDDHIYVRRFSIINDTAFMDIYSCSEILKKLHIKTTRLVNKFNYGTGLYETTEINCDPYYDLNEKGDKIVVVEIEDQEQFKIQLLTELAKYNKIEYKLSRSGLSYRCEYHKEIDNILHLKNIIQKYVQSTIKETDDIKDKYVIKKTNHNNLIEYIMHSMYLAKVRYIKTLPKNTDIKKDMSYEKAINDLITNEKLEITITAPILKSIFQDVKNFTAFCHNPFNKERIFDSSYIDASDIYKLNQYYTYDKQVNDRQSAIIGTDIMHYIKKLGIWRECSSVTSKLSIYSKLNIFIEKQYADKLAEIKNKLFTKRNTFNFDKKCNSCLGYCVEYYSKYLVYGKLYMKPFLIAALNESKMTELNNMLIVRACMLKYKDNMIKTFGSSMSKMIPTISVTSLIQDKYIEFVNTVVELGTKTASFVKEQMNITEPLTLSDKIYDPDLSVKHITALADYINKDTIIDIKTTNSISRAHIKQVLAYHYLSTKRSDLDIKRVIVYDSVSGKSITINI